MTRIDDLLYSPVHKYVDNVTRADTFYEDFQISCSKAVVNDRSQQSLRTLHDIRWLSCRRIAR